MRSTWLRWATAIYVILSLPLIAWLLVTNSGLRAERAKGLQIQTILLSNTLKGAVQSCEAALAAPSEPEAITRYLVNAEASLAQAEILELGYRQTTGQRTPLADVLGDYTLPLRFIREQVGRDQELGEAQRAQLATLGGDLALIQERITPDLLARGSQAEIASAFADLAPGLAHEVARARLSAGR